MEMFYELQKLAADLGFKSALVGGLYLPSSSSSMNYVGPSVNSKPEVASNGMAEVARATTSHNIAKDINFPMGFSGGGVLEASHSIAATTKINGAEVEAIANAVTSEKQPEKMDQMLVYDELVSEGWGSNHLNGGVVIPGDRASSRVKELFEKVNKNKARSTYLIDGFVFFIAMLVGIGIGVVLLKSFFPDLLQAVPFLRGY